MVTSSFATFVAIAGFSYSKPTVKAIDSFFFDSSLCSDGLMTVRLRRTSTISVPESRSIRPDVRPYFFAMPIRLSRVITRCSMIWMRSLASAAIVGRTRSDGISCDCTRIVPCEM